jgi:hypothetical protein
MELAAAAFVLWTVTCKAEEHEGVCQTSPYMDGRSSFATEEQCLRLGSVMEQRMREDFQPGRGWSLILDFWCDVKE